MKLHILVITEIIKQASPEELAPGGGLCHSLSVSEAEAQDSDWEPCHQETEASDKLFIFGFHNPCI